MDLLREVQSARIMEASAVESIADPRFPMGLMANWGGGRGLVRGCDVEALFRDGNGGGGAVAVAVAVATATTNLDRMLRQVLSRVVRVVGRVALARAERPWSALHRTCWNQRCPEETLGSALVSERGGAGLAVHAHWVNLRLTAAGRSDHGRVLGGGGGGG